MTILLNPGFLGRQFSWIAFIGIILATVLPQHAAANQFKRIRDVNVACNNALRCDIYITNRRVTLSSFGFRRTGEPGANIQLTLGSREAFRAGSDVVFIVDGVEILSAPVSVLNYRAATSEYFYRVNEDVISLLRATRAGAQLEISYTTRSGRSTVPFSLSGITAGLIFADEVQGRVGDDDALMALSAPVRNQGAATPVDASIRELSSWNDVPSSIGVNYGSDDVRCSNEFGNDERPPLGSIEAIVEDGAKLLALSCGDSGAYNFPYAFWIQNGENIFPLALPVMTVEGPSTSDLAWNITFDPTTRELTEFFKGRGLGDCGSFNRWKFVSEFGAYRFVLLEAKSKDNCDGIYTDDLSDYQQLWPAL